MPSSPGSDVFAVFALLFISAFVLLLLRYYLPLRTTPASLTVPIFLALALPISIILLVPIDLASTSATEDGDLRGIWLPQGLLLVVWRLTYWLTFALTWAILPLLGEYVDSGHRAPKDKFFYSLRSNGRYYLILFVTAGLAGIYVFLVNGFKTGSLKSLVMALAYCFGLVIVIYLMGNGLVAVPRGLFRNANLPARLRGIQSQAPKIHDKLNDATNELEELEAQLTMLRRRKNAVSRDHEDWIEEISDASDTADYRASNTRVSAPQLPAVITDGYLAEFSRKLMRARHKKIRFIYTWNRLVEDAVRMQAIVDAGASKRLTFAGSSKPAILTPYTRYLLHTKVLPAFNIFLGALCASASLCIVWSELIKVWLPNISVISLSVTKASSGSTHQITFRGQLLASFWLLYMSLCTLTSISKVKIWGNRALVPRTTYPESAAWYASQMAKLTVPLSYNFLTFLPKPVHHNTMFYKFLGVTINLTPLGTGFDYIFPIFILIPVSAALFNLYGRTSRFFSSGFIDDEDEEGGRVSAIGTGGWREGRDLIARELQSRARTGLSNRAASPQPRSTTLGQSNRGTDSPLRSSSPVRSSTIDTRPAVARHSTGDRQTASLAAATAAAEEEDESFFQGFAHRVKNTIDTIDKPAWLDDLGKRPKWMRGASFGGDGAGEEGSGRAESGRGLGRWFGGRPADGQVRL